MTSASSAPAPGVLLGSKLLPLAVLNAASAVLAALAVLFVWKTLVEAFGVPARRALWSAAMYGLGTMLLPYSKVPYSEALQSALTAALIYYTLAPPGVRTLPALALVVGLLVLTKPIHLAFLPLWWLAARAHGAFRVSTTASRLRALGLASACAACFFGWNYLRTGNLFDPYGASARATSSAASPPSCRGSRSVSSPRSPNASCRTARCGRGRWTGTGSSSALLPIVRGHCELRAQCCCCSRRRSSHCYSAGRELAISPRARALRRVRDRSRSCRRLRA